MSRIRLFVEWLAILACSCTIVWWAALSGATARIDFQLLDLASARRAAPASDDLLIVAIDDRSLAEVGQWPWDRRVMARLIDQVDKAGARAVVLDVLYIEPSEPDADAALADSMQRSGKVALANAFTPAENRTSGLDPLMPLPELAGQALAIGHVAFDPDADGTIRRVPVFVRDAGQVWPHLQLELMRALGEGDPPQASLLAREDRPPVMPLRKTGAYRTVPAASVLAGDVPDAFVKGRIVLVGAMAAGLGDTHPVPSYAGASMPGVELQANLRDALRHGEFIRRASSGATIGLSCLLLLVLFLGFWRLRPAMCLVLASLLILGSMVVAVAVAALWGLWFAPGPVMLAMVAAYPLWGWRRLAAVSDFLASEAGKLAPTGGEPDAESLGGFDNVAKQVSRLHYLVDEVAERRAFLTTVIEAAPDAICVFGADERLTLTNQRARAIFGDGQEGLTLNDLIVASRASLISEGREMTLPDGSAFAVAMSRTPGEGAAAGLRVVAFVDITDLRRAEEERRHMLEFLSHDMRSPQVAIVGLANARDDMGEAPERLARIAVHARRTLKLADDFVQLSRLSQAPLELEEVDLCMLAEEAIDRAWFAAREKGIGIAQHLPDEPVYIRADGHVLSRAIDNLIGNAIKYSPEGTKVAVSVVTGADSVRLQISDQGPGMPLSRRQDPFRRFGSRNKQDGSGAGLGLAFVQAAVVRHGADIACESGADGGTSFTIGFAVQASDG